MEVPQNGWFIVEIPIKMDDLGVPPFQETSNCHSTVYNRKTCKTSIVVIVLITHFMKHILCCTQYAQHSCDVKTRAKADMDP